MKTLITYATIIFAVTFSVLFAEDKGSKVSPDLTNLQYIVKAESVYIRSIVQAEEPHWLYVKQGDDNFTIVGGTHNTVRVCGKPSQIPQSIKQQLQGIATSSSEAKTAVEEGPFSGHQGVFAIFDSEKRIVLLIYNWHGILVAESARTIMGSDTFQCDGEWTSYQSNNTLLKLLSQLAPETPKHRRPFELWHKAVEQDTSPNH